MIRSLLSSAKCVFLPMNSTSAHFLGHLLLMLFAEGLKADQIQVTSISNRKMYKNSEGEKTSSGTNCS